MVFLLLFLANRGFINSVFIYFNSVVILFWSLGFHRAIEENMFKILLISIITYGANNCISTLKKLNVNFKVNSAKICFYALLPSLLISQISLMLPYDGKYDKSVKEKFVSNYNDINKLDLDKTSFGLQLSGYCDSKKKLGGPININDDLVLKVKSEKPIYLRGNVKDNYNGSMWIKIDDSHRKQLSKLGDVYNPESSVFKPSYDSRTLEIFPQQAKISTIFAPMYTYSIIMDGNIFYDDIPTFVGEVSKNKKYYVSYYYNEEEEYFENCKNVNWLNENTNLEEAQSSYSLYNNYLQIPNTITDRTKDLLRKITEGSKTSYEKISKIKQYLQTYYPYSMNVSVVPDNRDFIDYFLFSEKKGYCVYFATAATMLCRL